LRLRTEESNYLLYKLSGVSFVELTEKQIERLNYWIKTSFHFIQYPDPCPEFFWIDRNGKWISMSNMELDHLKACANLVEREIKSSLECISRSDPNRSIFDEFIIKPAQAKQAELREVLKKKVGL